MYKLVDLFPYYDPEENYCRGRPDVKRVLRHLRQIAYILVDRHFDGSTLRFGELMKAVSAMTGQTHVFYGCCVAIMDLNDLFYEQTGHLIGACLLGRDGSPSKRFFEKAVELGLLDEQASPAEREEFWMEEAEFFQRKSWGQLLDMLDDIFGE